MRRLRLTTIVACARRRGLKLLGSVAVMSAVGCAGLELPPRAQPPSVAQPGSAAEVVLEGSLDVLIEDSDRGSRVLYFLLSGDRRIPLRFLADPADLVTGTHVLVQGRWETDGTLVVVAIARLQASRSPNW